MNPARELPTRPAQSLDSAIEAAMHIIAPSWPLDRQIAVNPWWGFIGRSFADASTTLGRLLGARFTLPAGEYRRAWQAGEITPRAIERAIAEMGSMETSDSVVAALEANRAPGPGLPLLSDVIDLRSTPAAGPRWRDTITQQISQYCASYFDHTQADWHRGQTAGLFEGWRRGLESDHALEPLMQAPEIRARVRELPATPDAAIGWSVARLGVPTDEVTEFLQVCLLRINGWASWCAWLGWQAGLDRSVDPHLRELLAIRVSWEALLHDGRGEAGSPGTDWRERWTRSRCAEPSRHDATDLLWQRAQEISYQDRLVNLLDQADAQRNPEGTRYGRPQDGERPSAQLVFCIDVRSERFRRALENADATLETRGFAGSFGLPIRYTPIGTRMSRPQLPGLLTPTLDVADSTDIPREDAAIAHRRVDRLQAKKSFQPFLRMPSGAFSLVETLGIGYAAEILRRHFGSYAGISRIESLGLAQREIHSLHPRPGLTGSDCVGQQADLVASILRAMGLTRGFARLLVFIGHGSQSANNPQSAALDCGACGGHPGEINARVLAGLLNDGSIRLELRNRGITIPPDTIAVGALHNTTTDEVQLFDVAQLPHSHAPDLERLQRSLLEAGHETRLERAPSLGLGSPPRGRDVLLKQIRRRARDWAETRPEWGLADNAGFIIAPRYRTRGLNLEGRCFLHDYLRRDDPDGTVLEMIMTAPMIVTHWINLQYYASTVDPERFGSGNKVLHNVACGRIGVFEGNTGDLRIGLSRQSLHDGERRMHTPLRLSVFIDAPRDRIDRVLARHVTVRELVDNEWLYLFRFADAGIERRYKGEWGK